MFRLLALVCLMVTLVGCSSSYDAVAVADGGRDLGTHEVSAPPHEVREAMTYAGDMLSVGRDHLRLEDDDEPGRPLSFGCWSRDLVGSRWGVVVASVESHASGSRVKLRGKLLGGNFWFGGRLRDAADGLWANTVRDLRRDGWR